MNWMTSLEDSQANHALLSPSRVSWLNYDEEKLRDYYLSSLAVERGNRLHAFANEAISLGIPLRNSSDTLNMFINDAIFYGMRTEQLLYYSDFCYGTTDAIVFNDSLVRIHDLKTGKTPSKPLQVDIYSALFCLNHHITPSEISFINRIYQNNTVIEWSPTSIDIYNIMQNIVEKTQLLNNMRNMYV